MKFEKALASMRRGKTVVGPDGHEVTLENGKFIICAH